MEYFAHVDEGNRDRKQTLKEHLEGTAGLAAQFAESFGKKDWGYCCGMLHDIGKYSEAFQKKLEENSNRQVDHSTAGAQVCMEKGGLYGYMSYCIAGHHTGLPDYGSSFDTDGTLEARKRKKVESYQAYRDEIRIPDVKTLPFDQRTTKNPDFSMSTFIRMLYSCLVDADFLDTERFMKNERVERDAGESMGVLLEKLDQHISGWLQNDDLETVNGRRTEILKHCLDSGEAEKGMFRLTVPTGGGKTIASLAFALNHAVKHQMDRVIYVIPYTSIIEQNAGVFRDILGERNVLEHHCNVDYRDAEELIPMQLASENWDKPVVVTTNVQFFESLFANKSSRCRKLHNIANSVIVLDEAQMLPNDYLVPCTAMLEELVRNYRSSVVLCTATQPALDSFFPNITNIIELCPRMEEQFRFFERVNYQNLGAVFEEDLVGRLENENQALCIVNTRKQAQRVYQQLKGDGVYHLSTTMYPKHRYRILDKIRKRLKDQKKCIVISTSLVEAGVDLDFETVYRQIAGVDSIIQAAGRCNREGKRCAAESVVCLFWVEGKESVPGQRQQIDVTKNLLAEGWELSSQKMVEEYFQRLYHFRGEGLDKKRIMEEFRKQRYNFSKVGKEFRLIEENAKTIYIPLEEEAKQLLQKMKCQGYTKSGMREAGKYCVQVYEKDFDKLYGAGMIQRISEDIEDYYELVNFSQYTDEMGLSLDVESGIAIFS